MDHADHVALIAGAVEHGGTWADLGSGEGAFTLARRFPAVPVTFHAADLTLPLALPALDGILMANSLHFVRDREAVVRGVVQHLRPGGRFVAVEYDTDEGNRWVPHPLAAASWEHFAASAGLAAPRILARVPSRWLGAIWSGAATYPGR